MLVEELEKKLVGAIELKNLISNHHQLLKTEKITKHILSLSFTFLNGKTEFMILRRNPDDWNHFNIIAKGDFDLKGKGFFSFNNINCFIKEVKVVEKKYKLLQEQEHLVHQGYKDKKYLVLEDGVFRGIETSVDELNKITSFLKRKKILLKIKNFFK